MGQEHKKCAACGVDYDPDVLFCPKDGTPLASAALAQGKDPNIGARILDQIRIEQLIGIGSMGRVYRAFQSGIERDVAVKILHAELSSNPAIVERFSREAKIASRLQHPHVVQVLMAGQLPKTAGAGAGALYLVMEYLDGISLSSALAAAGGALPLPRSLYILLQMCEAVGEAHAQGIVHRDLKPENVVLVRRGGDGDFAKVLDFGIARQTGNLPSVTKAGLVFGTPRYLSPEGAAGEPVGPPSDVYALATMLYQMLSARTPFESASQAAMLVQKTIESAPELSSVPRASYVPAPLARAIMKNLARTPAERCADARAFGRELVDAARASGLAPEELVPRSLLLGASGRAGAFSSIERTKEHEFTPSLADAVASAGGSRRRPT